MPHDTTEHGAALRASNRESNRITRESLETALLQLMETKDIRDISIEAIVRRAGVSRMAYYRNFSSKEDILDSVFEYVESGIYEKLLPYAARGDMYGLWLELFRSAGAVSGQYMVLIRAHLGERLLSLFSRVAINATGGDSLAARYTTCCFAGAIYNVLTHWIEDGARETPEEMAGICSRFLGGVNGEGAQRAPENGRA